MSTTKSSAGKPPALTTMERMITRSRQTSGPSELAALLCLLQTNISQVAGDLAAVIEKGGGQVPAALDADITDAELCQLMKALLRQLTALVLGSRDPGATAGWLLPSMRQQLDYSLELLYGRNRNPLLLAPENDICPAASSG